MAARACEGLIVLSGRARRATSAQALARGRPRRREALARDWATDFPGAFYIEVQRVDPRTQRALVQAAVALAGRARAAGRRDAPGAVRQARGLHAPTKRACASRRATCWATSAARATSARRSTSSRRPRWPSSSPTCPRRSRTRWRSRAAAPSSSRWARAGCRTSRRRAGESIEDYLRAQSRGGLEQRLAAALSRTPREREAERPALPSSGSSSRWRPSSRWGFPGYFLIVADFINWAKTQRRARGPGARLGRGLAGGLFARHHRPRPAALRPAVRALPQSRARVDARLRHRLLPGRARPRDRLREARSTARRASRRSPPSAPWRRRRWCATWAACSACPTARSTASPS